MLRTISKKDISIAVDFAWKLSRKPETSNKTNYFFIDDCEAEDLNMVQKVGFNYFSSYRCYEVWL